MSKFKKLIIFALTLTMLLAIPMVTQAATKDTHTYSTFKSGMTVTFDDADTCYKMTVTEDSYYKITNTLYEGEYSCQMLIYKYKPTPANEKKYGSAIYYNQYSLAGKNPTFMLKKGTYYVSFGCMKKCTVKKISYSYGKTAKMSKATVIKAGKMVTDMQTASCPKYAWHKITLTRSQVISIYAEFPYAVMTNKGSACDVIKLYDAKKKAVKLSYAGNKNTYYDGILAKYTTKKLAKGTYYVRVGLPAGAILDGTNEDGWYPVYEGISFKWN